MEMLILFVGLALCGLATVAGYHGILLIGLPVAVAGAFLTKRLYARQAKVEADAEAERRQSVPNIEVPTFPQEPR